MKEITIKVKLSGNALREFEAGRLSLIDTLSNELDIPQEDIEVFQRLVIERCVEIKGDGLIAENVKNYHGQIAKDKMLVKNVLMKCLI